MHITTNATYAIGMYGWLRQCALMCCSLSEWHIT